MSITNTDINTKTIPITTTTITTTTTTTMTTATTTTNVLIDQLDDKPENLLSHKQHQQQFLYPLDTQHSRNTIESYSSNTTANSCSPSACSIEHVCKHKRIIKNSKYDNCAMCGVMVPRNGSTNYKSKSLHFTTLFSSNVMYEAMIAKSFKFNQERNNEYSKLRQTYVDWIFELSEKLKFTLNTTHLAICLLDILLFKDSQYNSQLQLYAPIALLIAAKTIELDERIPYISKMRRLANPIYSSEEFKRAELVLLEAVEWNPIFATNLELLEFYLCQGVINSNDEIEVDITQHDYFSNSSNTSNASNASDNNNNIYRSKDLKTSPSSLPSLCPLNKVLKEKNTLSSDTSIIAVRSLNDLDLNIKTMMNTVSHSKENDENAYNTGLTNPMTIPQISTTSKLTTTSHPFVSSLSSNLLTNGEANMMIPDTLDNDDKDIEKYSFRKTSTLDDACEDKKAKKFEKINIDKVQYLLSRFEKDIVKIANLIAKDNDFLCFEPKILASSSIAFLRNFYKFLNPWNTELEVLTSLKYDGLTLCFDLIKKKFENNFQSAHIANATRANLGMETIPSYPKQENNCAEIKLFDKGNIGSTITTAIVGGKSVMEGSEDVSKLNSYGNGYQVKNTENPLSYELLLKERERKREREHAKIFNFQPKHNTTTTVNYGILHGGHIGGTGAGGYSLRSEDILQQHQYHKQPYASTHAYELKSDREYLMKYHNSTTNIMPTLTKYGSTDHVIGSSIASNSLLEARASYTTTIHAGLSSYNHIGNNTHHGTGIYGTTTNAGNYMSHMMSHNDIVSNPKLTGLLNTRNIGSKISCGLYHKKI